ncbi:14-3-3 superfamily protein [Toxoplasma gondii GT1]|uniref:14-3-3 superfamily protein n=6 Tax=Toxoplasma gondii TaxID=5811 RepID=S7V4X7_TOXGG|nr:14-3-3 superfamily protein [Toxoplasma gondii GT1]KAF4642324.1 14-3-3 superfamily protein [Toxoplasma gondii]
MASLPAPLSPNSGSSPPSPSTASLPFGIQLPLFDSAVSRPVSGGDAHRHTSTARIFPVLSSLAGAARNAALSPAHSEQRAAVSLGAQEADGDKWKQTVFEGNSGSPAEPRKGFLPDAHLLLAPTASTSFVPPLVSFQEKEAPQTRAAEDLAHLQAQASIAANLENWQDVIRVMKKLAQVHPNLDSTQRSLVVDAYTNLANEACAARKTLDGCSSALAALSAEPACSPEEQGAEKSAVAESEEQSLSRDGEEKQTREEAALSTLKTLGLGLVSATQLHEFTAFFEFCVNLYKQRVTDDLFALNEDVDRFVLGVLLPQAENHEATAAYQQLRGDVSRHTAALTKNAEIRRRMEERALRAYESALQSTEQDDELKVTPLHLGIVLNYGVLLKSINQGQQTNRAIELIAAAFRYSVENMYHVRNEEEYQRVLVILSLLRDNIEKWCAETGRTDVQALLGMDYRSLSSGQSLDAGSTASFA